MRGWVSRLKFQLVLASAVILESESRLTHDHNLLSQTRKTPPTWSARSPCLYPPGTGWSSYIRRHWVPLSLPATTRRATVEVLEPALTLAAQKTSTEGSKKMYLLFDSQYFGTK
jgi:hypothetical protein